jgi:hypothetical protein
MRLARASFAALLITALAVFTVDCFGVTSEQAMQCCRSMRCSSHGHQHGSDCCKQMPELRAALGQPSSVQTAVFSPVVFALVAVDDKAFGFERSDAAIVAYSHGPPGSSSPPSLLPLRI